MSNRMSVLSRRLRSFAIFFSFATVASFVVGMILTSSVGMIFSSDAARNKAVFSFAALVSVCFFAAFFLWLARGFAWAMVPTKEPVEEKEIAEERWLAPEKLVAEREASEEKKLAAGKTQVPENEPVQEKPTEEKKLVWEEKPTEEKKLVWEEKPLEEKPASEEGAVYTITGRRIK
jgi:hypothetical protein